MLPDCSLELDEDNESAKSIVDKILALPDKERLWPNCLNRPIRNATHVNMDEYFEKSSKAVVKYEGATSEKPVSKSAAGRTRSKQPVTILTPSKSMMSVSSESGDSPKVEMGIQLSVGRQFAKEFKPPSFQAMTISSKDPFAKRVRDEKSTETESSKATVIASPESKRVKIVGDHSGTVCKASIAHVVHVHKHSVGARPSSFVLF